MACSRGKDALALLPRLQLATAQGRPLPCVPLPAALFLGVTLSGPAFQYGAASWSTSGVLVGVHVSVLGPGARTLNASLCPFL